MDEGGEITHEEMGKVPPPLSQEPLVCRQTLTVLREAEAQLAPCGFPGRREVSRPQSDGAALTAVYQHPATLQGRAPKPEPGGAGVPLHSPSLSLGLEPGQPASSL